MPRLRFHHTISRVFNSALIVASIKQRAPSDHSGRPIRAVIGSSHLNCCMSSDSDPVMSPQLDGGILTEAQVQALEKKKHDDEACGEIETAHPGYLGSQDTLRPQK